MTRPVLNLAVDTLVTSHRNRYANLRCLFGLSPINHNNEKFILLLEKTSINPFSHNPERAIFSVGGIVCLRQRIAGVGLMTLLNHTAFSHAI